MTGDLGGNGKGAPTFLWFDVHEIEKEHDRYVQSDEELLHHIELIHRSMEFHAAVLRHTPFEQHSKVVAVLRLGVRLFNSAGAALQLARSGYFQPSLSMTRDLLEISFLLDLFRRDRSELDSWIGLDSKQRNDRFKPVAVRIKLDKLDGVDHREREAAYKRLSSYAAHVSPEGFSVISPGWQTITGPFRSHSLLKAAVEELVQAQIPAIKHFSEILSPESPEVRPAEATFAETWIAWRTRYHF